jgi:hypothetical protein
MVTHQGCPQTPGRRRGPIPAMCQYQGSPVSQASALQSGNRVRRLGLVLALAATLTSPLPGFADPVTAAAPKDLPMVDHSFMVVGCMGGLALGALSVVFVPVAGAWMGGLGLLIVRGGLGCAYGSLAGAVASAARATVQWSHDAWQDWTGQPPSRLPMEHPAGS